MPTYHVYMVNTVSAVVTVEADTWSEAIDLAYDSEDMPGSITVGAFGAASVDDGEWTAQSVMDGSHRTVWEES